MPPQSTSRKAGRPPSGAGEDGRESLLRAARELLAESGPQGITLRAIAERAGVRAPLVNYYFGSKTGLYTEVVGTIRDELLSKLADPAREDAPYEDRFRHAVGALLQALAADPYAPRLVMEQFIGPDDERTDAFVEQIARPQLERFMGLILEGIALGQIRDVDPRFAFSSLMGLCVFYFLSSPLMSRAFEEDMRSPEKVEAYQTYVADLLLRGLAPDEPPPLPQTASA